MNKNILILMLALLTAYSCGDKSMLETENSDSNLPGLEWVFVKGGYFQMGESSTPVNSTEQSGHTVTLSDFYISKYEITNAQFALFLHKYGCDTIKSGIYSGQKIIFAHKWGLTKTDNGWIPVPGYEKHPVLNVPWYGAVEFCKYFGWTLTTEAQWEYAARGGEKSRGYIYSGSNDIEEVGWYSPEMEDAPGVHSHPVGEKKPNELGLYDMTGNAWEWCYDWYGEYSQTIVNDPEGPASGSNHVYRGGGWLSTAVNSKNISRHGGSPDYHGFTHNGFRCVSKSFSN